MIKFRIQAVFYFLKEVKNAHFLTLSGKNSTLIRSSPIKKAFNWSYPVEIHGRFYILVVQYVPM